jgi:hypothetical protein
LGEVEKFRRPPKKKKRGKVSDKYEKQTKHSSVPREKNGRCDCSPASSNPHALCRLRPAFFFGADSADNVDKGSASGQIGFADGSSVAPTSSRGEPKKQVSAQRAVVIASTEKLASDQNLPETLFHGPKEQNVRVDVGKDSTAQGELLPAPWGADGQVSETYLMKGCKFEEHVLTGGKSETIKALKDSSKLGTYIQNLTESDQELKRLHASHIPQESKTITFDSILQKMGPEETVFAKVACKALINAPATGYDIVSDLVVVMTRIKSDAAPGGYQRRVYFFHVRCRLQLGMHFTALTSLRGSAGGRARAIERVANLQQHVAIRRLLRFGFGQQLGQGVHGLLAADIDLHGLPERGGPDRANVLSAGAYPATFSLTQGFRFDPSPRSARPPRF